MHLKHILATSLLALLSSPVSAQGVPELNVGFLTVRDLPNSLGAESSMPSTSSTTTTTSMTTTTTSTSSTSTTPTSSMATTMSSTASNSTMPTSTPSTLSSSMKPTSSSSMGPTSTPTPSGNSNMLGNILHIPSLQMRAQPVDGGSVPGYAQPVSQPGASTT